MQDMEEVEALRFLYSKMLKSKDNKEFLSMLNESA
jgi:transcription termination factor Rho